MVEGNSAMPGNHCCDVLPSWAGCCSLCWGHSWWPACLLGISIKGNFSQRNRLQTSFISPGDLAGTLLVQIPNVPSDVVGQSGQKILRAIFAGERAGQVLGAMKNARVRASVQDRERQEPGGQLAPSTCSRLLKQAPQHSTSWLGTQLTECDHEIELQLTCPLFGGPDQG